MTAHNVGSQQTGDQSSQNSCLPSASAGVRRKGTIISRKFHGAFLLSVMRDRFIEKRQLPFLYKIRSACTKIAARDFFCKGSSPGVLPGGAEIFLGGDAVLFFKGAEKSGCSPKAAGLVHLGDGQALLNEGQQRSSRAFTM